MISKFFLLAVSVFSAVYLGCMVVLFVRALINSLIRKKFAFTASHLVVILFWLFYIGSDSIETREVFNDKDF